MTICNMTIEGGGRAGMIAPDDTTFEWIEGRPGAPEDFDAAVERWRELRTDDGASFDRELTVDAGALSPLVTWGTTPAMVVPVTESVPDPRSDGDERALQVHGPRGRDADAGDPPRPRVHRLVHELAHRRPARRRRARRGPQGRRRRARDGRARLAARGRPGRGGGARRGLPRRRLRLALGGLLDVPGDEPRHPPARRALRLDLEPQLRGPPGPRRAHPPRLAADGRRGGDRGPLRRHHGDRMRRTRRGRRPAEVLQGRLRPVSVLDRADVDTDQIIPKQFLKRVERTGFGEFLFYDWKQGGRLGPAAQPDPRHRAELRLAARAASTRPWALEDYGFRAVVAASFADIFFSNCTKIGLLPVVLPEEEVRALMAAGEAEVDLEALEVRFDGRAVPFELNAETRRRLLEGLDDIAIALQHDDEISAYEAERERPGPNDALSATLRASRARAARPHLRRRGAAHRTRRAGLRRAAAGRRPGGPAAVRPRRADPDRLGQRAQPGALPAGLRAPRPVRARDARPRGALRAAAAVRVLGPRGEPDARRAAAAAALAHGARPRRGVGRHAPRRPRAAASCCATCSSRCASAGRSPPATSPRSARGPRGRGGTGRSPRRRSSCCSGAAR